MLTWLVSCVRRHHGGVGGGLDSPTGVVAAGAVALVLLPLRDRLQTSVDRLVYGARRDPLGAVREVGVSVSTVTTDPLATVPGGVAGGPGNLCGGHRREAAFGRAGADGGGPRLAFRWR